MPYAKILFVPKARASSSRELAREASPRKNNYRRLLWQWVVKRTPWIVKDSQMVEFKDCPSATPTSFKILGSFSDLYGPFLDQEGLRNDLEP